MSKSVAAFALVAFGWAAPAFGQIPEPTPIHSSTAGPAGARYEIVQSTLAVRWTFRLDRFTGSVAQLVQSSQGDLRWDRMLVIDLSPIQAPGKPRFQIFLSGIAARNTYLLDTDTGRTWQLVKAKDETMVWEPF